MFCSSFCQWLCKHGWKSTVDLLQVLCHHKFRISHSHCTETSIWRILKNLVQVLSKVICSIHLNNFFLHLGHVAEIIKTSAGYHLYWGPLRRGCQFFHQGQSTDPSSSKYCSCMRRSFSHCCSIISHCHIHSSFVAWCIKEAISVPCQVLVLQSHYKVKAIATAPLEM